MAATWAPRHALMALLRVSEGCCKEFHGGEQHLWGLAKTCNVFLEPSAARLTRAWWRSGPSQSLAQPTWKFGKRATFETGAPLCQKT